MFFLVHIVVLELFLLLLLLLCWMLDALSLSVCLWCRFCNNIQFQWYIQSWASVYRRFFMFMCHKYTRFYFQIDVSPNISYSNQIFVVRFHPKGFVAIIIRFPLSFSRQYSLKLYLFIYFTCTWYLVVVVVVVICVDFSLNRCVGFYISFQSSIFFCILLRSTKHYFSGIPKRFGKFVLHFIESNSEQFRLHSKQLKHYHFYMEHHRKQMRKGIGLFFLHWMLLNDNRMWQRQKHMNSNIRRMEFLTKIIFAFAFFFYFSRFYCFDFLYCLFLLVFYLKCIFCECNSFNTALSTHI